MTPHQTIFSLSRRSDRLVCINGFGCLKEFRQIYSDRWIWLIAGVPTDLFQSMDSADRRSSDKLIRIDEFCYSQEFQQTYSNRRVWLSAGVPTFSEKLILADINHVIENLFPLSKKLSVKSFHYPNPSSLILRIRNALLILE